MMGRISGGPHLGHFCASNATSGAGPVTSEDPCEDPHRLSAKSWRPRRAWAARARTPHGATAKGSAKRLGCPRRESGVTDGVLLLGICRRCYRPLPRRQTDTRDTRGNAVGGQLGSQTRRQRAPKPRSGSLADHAVRQADRQPGQTAYFKYGILGPSCISTCMHAVGRMPPAASIAQLLLICGLFLGATSARTIPYSLRQKGPWGVGRVLNLTTKTTKRQDHGGQRAAQQQTASDRSGTRSA